MCYLEGGRVEELGREENTNICRSTVYFSLDKLSIFPNLIEVLFPPIYQRQSTFWADGLRCWVFTFLQGFGLMVFVAGCSHFYTDLCLDWANHRGR
jgi:hypothetical protein